MKQKMNLRQELDLTRDGTAEMTRWCIIIALHQCFGVGKDRLNRIELRAEELGLESLNIAMQANGKGMPSTDQSRSSQIEAPSCCFSSCHIVRRLFQSSESIIPGSNTPMPTITVMQTMPRRMLTTTHTMLVMSLERMSWVSVTGRVCIR